MKIMVCLKQVPHQDARLDVNGDGSLDQGRQHQVRDQQLRHLRARGGAADQGRRARPRCVVVSIGPERVTQALRTALGMGADRAIHVKDPATEGSDALGIAKILAAIAKQESPDLDLHGPDVRRRQLRVGAADARASSLGIPHATGAVAVSRSNGTLTRRSRDRGRRERGGRAQDAVPDRGADRPEPGPLRVAQGHHGGEEEAARREDRRRPRRRGRRSARARRRSRSRRSRRPRRATAPRSCPAPPTRWWPGSSARSRSSGSSRRSESRGVIPMGSILIVAEIQNGQIREASLRARRVRAEARGRERPRREEPRDGPGHRRPGRGSSRSAAAEPSTRPSTRCSQNYSAETAAAAIRAAIAASGADVVLISNTPSGWDVAPRIAAALDAGFVSDCFAIDVADGHLAFKRRVFNGKLDARDLDLGRQGRRDGAAGRHRAVLGLDRGLGRDARGAARRGRAQEQVRRDQEVATRRASTSSKADIIVSGGRGVGDPGEVPRGDPAARERARRRDGGQPPRRRRGLAARTSTRWARRARS